jgi:[ribosomal protein S5]-alanine N-acetyltransferase
VDVTAEPISDADAGEFLQAVQASRDLHRPWIDLPDTTERFAAYMGHVSRDDQSAYLLRHSTCGGLVGYVNVSNIVRRAFQSASLGFGAFVGHQGRGLMTAGLRTVIGLSFGDLGLHRVEANIQPGNRRSIALVRRLGFEKEGFSPAFLMVDGDWRDHERWALRVESFRPDEPQRAAPGGAA